MSAENFFHCAPDELSAAERVVGLAMYTFANEHDLFAASVESIAKLTKLTTKTVCRAIPALIEHGVIARVSEAKGQQHAIYRLLLLPQHIQEGGQIVHAEGGQIYMTVCQVDPIDRHNVSRAIEEDLSTSSVRVYGTETDREKELGVLELARRACTREEQRTSAHMREENDQNTQTDFFRFRGTEHGSRKKWPGPTYALPRTKEKEKSFAKKEKESPRQATSIDKSFVLNDEDIAFAKERKWTPGQIALERERFVAYFEGRGDRMLDWHAKWRFWVLNDVKFAIERRIKDAKTRGNERPKGL